MATLRRQIALNAPAATVWSALRDFGAVHTRVAPGFLTKLEMDKGDRIVTFFNGMVARERLVTVDDEDCRLVYSVVEGRASHYNAAVQVFPEGDDRSRPVCPGRIACQHLDGREVAGVKREVFARGLALWIEPGVPVRVDPAGRTDAHLAGHPNSLGGDA